MNVFLISYFRNAIKLFRVILTVERLPGERFRKCLTKTNAMPSTTANTKPPHAVPTKAAVLLPVFSPPTSTVTIMFIAFALQ